MITETKGMAMAERQKKFNCTLQIVIGSAWTLAYSALWKNCVFSEAEIKAAKRFIYQYLVDQEDIYKAYLCFCQRILLVQDYVRNDVDRFVPLPSHWLDPNNTNGFAGTKDWYTRLVATRKSLPLFKMELKAVAEAVLEMREAPSLNNFQYWTSYFREKKCDELYTLFLTVVLRGQYEDY